LNQPLPGTARSGRVALTARRAPDGCSYIARQHATYPFHICRPHYVAGDPGGMATLYLQSSAGGVFEHDRLAMELTIDDGAALHVTSQGATIVHAMTGGEAHLATELSAGRHAIVELLPEATILFPGARLELATVVRADETAVVCVGEAILAHDPEGGGAIFERFTSDIRFETADGRTLAHDRQSVGGDAFRALASDAARPFAGYAGIHLWAPRRDLVRLRSETAEALARLDGTYAGASILPGVCGLGIRILANDGVSLRRAWVTGWQVIHQVLFATLPSPRRK